MYVPHGPRALARTDQWVERVRVVVETDPAHAVFPFVGNIAVAVVAVLCVLTGRAVQIGPQRGYLETDAAEFDDVALAEQVARPKLVLHSAHYHPQRLCVRPDAEVRGVLLDQAQRPAVLALIGLREAEHLLDIGTHSVQVAGIRRLHHTLLHVTGLVVVQAMRVTRPGHRLDGQALRRI